MLINSIPFSLIVDPVTLVDVSICMNESSFAICLVTGPHPLIDATILPYLCPLTFPQVSINVPATLISCWTFPISSFIQASKMRTAWASMPAKTIRGVTNYQPLTKLFTPAVAAVVGMS